MEYILNFIKIHEFILNNIFFYKIIFLIILIFFLLKNTLYTSKKKNSYIHIVEKVLICPSVYILIIDIEKKRFFLSMNSKKINLLYIFPILIKSKKNKNISFIFRLSIFNNMINNFYKIFWKYTMIYKFFIFFILLFFCPVVYASESYKFSEILNNVFLNGDTKWPLSIQTSFFLFSLTFIPVFILMMTSFTRIIIVFGLLRNALGTPYSPPNQILLGMALFLTFFIMHPTFNEIYKDAYLPFSQHEIKINVALQKAIIPIRSFMIHQIRKPDLNLFSHLDHIPLYSNKNDIPMRILIPSFMTSELKTAFQIGFTILIPFLIIDLVVSSVLISLGMMMVPPSSISLPFKLILFVLADGWRLLFSSLVQSFY